MTRIFQRARFRRDHQWTPRNLSAFLDDELVIAARARLLHHLDECPECQSALRSLRRMLGRMRDLPSPAVQERPDLAANIRRRLSERRVQ